MENVFNMFDEYIIILDELGNIITCNDKMISKMGYNQDELKGININKILTNDINRILINKKDTNVDLEFYSKSKKKFNLNCKININKYNGCMSFFLVCKDVSTKLHTIDDLEMLLDSVCMCIWIKDINGKYIYANKNLEKLTRKSKSEIIGKYDEDIWSKEDAIKYKEHQSYILKNKKGKVLEETNTLYGETKLLETYRIPVLDKNDNIKYVGGISNDVTLKRKIEKELHYNYNQSNMMNNVTDEKDDDEYMKSSLDNICKYFLKGINADGISIIDYKSLRKELIPYLGIGCSTKLFDNMGVIKLSDEKKVVLDNLIEGTRPIDEINEIDIYKNLLDEDVEYLGLYKINLNNEFLGLLNISYKKDNKPKINQDQYIKFICKQIAVVVENYRLSKQVKLQNKKREDSEKELELFLNTAIDLMGIIGEDGYFKKVTPKWSEVLGWSQEELLKMHCKELLHPDDVEISLNAVRQRYEKPYYRSLKLRYLSKSGECIYIDWTCNYIKDQNCFIITGKDITEEKKMEVERKKLEKAIELESIKNEFFANISHEFKTPLNIILGSMQLLDKNIKNDTITVEKLNKSVGTIRQNSYRLLRLVNNLIDMSRIDTGYYELQVSNNNIVSIIEDITLSVVNYVEDKNINLIFDTNIEEEIIACDPDKIERIILNLLSNAIKYTNENGEISVSLYSDNKKITVEVKDNGVGIPPEKIDVIFDRFRQANSVLTRRCEGSGIGLSLVKSLIEMHGGNIWVESKINEGTQFIFELPIVLTTDIEDIYDMSKDLKDNQIEKCNIEFSDIYSL